MFKSAQKPGIRLYAIAICIGIVFGVFILRLFQLQVISHGKYSELAQHGQLRKFVLPATRGEIYVHDGERGMAPLALNQTKRLIYADPQYIKNPEQSAHFLSQILELPYDEVFARLTSDSRYEVVAKGVAVETAKTILDEGFAGVGISNQDIRVYPENSLASHITGFVNGENFGQYGVEQYFDAELRGVEGLLQAQTDVRGIPIATADNVELVPTEGRDILLTIDRAIQSKTEQALQDGLKRVGSKSGSVVVMDPRDGRVLAMANYPSFDPNKFSDVADFGVFENNAATEAYEVGSVFKVFTMAAGLQEGRVTAHQTYYDHGYEVVDNFTIRNAPVKPAQSRTMTDVITNSLNTGAIHVLKQLGGGEIDEQAKQTLYSYFSDTFRFGKPTGIELVGEASGYIESPQARSNVAYANMTFGQGLSATPLQVAAALSSLVNGGTYYQPQLLDGYLKEDKFEDKQPHIIATDVVSAETSRTIRAMMQTVVENGGGYSAQIAGYNLGGKTGSAQIAHPEGGYYLDRFIGSFAGIGPVERPEFVIVVRVDEPQVSGYAGSEGAAPIFADIAHWMLDYLEIPPS